MSNNRRCGVSRQKLLSSVGCPQAKSNGMRGATRPAAEFRKVNMANNIISRWIELGDSLDGNHYAAQLDRLVETTRKLVEDADGDDPDYLTVTPALVEAVVSALREIELTSDASSERTQNVC